LNPFMAPDEFEIWLVAKISIFGVLLDLSGS
jgi:hypothetical protein